MRVEMIQDRLLEPVRPWIRAECGAHVPRVTQRGADLVRFLSLSFDRIRDVGIDRFPEFPADDVSADDMRDRSHGPEPLLPEEVREAAMEAELARGLLDRRGRLLRRDGDVPHDDAEAVAAEISDFKPRLGPIDIDDLEVLHVKRPNPLEWDILERDQLRRDGALVLCTREADAAAAHVQPPRELPDEPVRLPIPNPHRRDGVAALRGRRWRGRDLLDDEILRAGLENPADARGRRQVAFDPDVSLHGPMRAPSPGVVGRRRTPPRRLPRRASARPAGCP